MLKRTAISPVSANFCWAPTSAGTQENKPVFQANHLLSFLSDNKNVSGDHRQLSFSLCNASLPRSNPVILYSSKPTPSPGPSFPNPPELQNLKQLTPSGTKTRQDETVSHANRRTNINCQARPNIIVSLIHVKKSQARQNFHLVSTSPSGKTKKNWATSSSFSHFSMGFFLITYFSLASYITKKPANLAPVDLRGLVSLNLTGVNQ